MEERIAKAAAEGRLDDFVASEFGNSPHARSLAGLMMGMTGMAHGSPPRPGTETEKKQNQWEKRQ